MADARAEQTTAAPAAGAEAGAADEPERESEPEEKALTLGEYLASLAAKQAGIAANRKDVRQVEATPEAAKAVTKTSEAEASYYFAAVSKDKAHKPKKDKSREQIDTSFTFVPPTTARGRAPPPDAAPVPATALAVAAVAGPLVAPVTAPAPAVRALLPAAPAARPSPASTLVTRRPSPRSAPKLQLTPTCVGAYYMAMACPVPGYAVRLLGQACSAMHVTCAAAA